MISLTGTLHGLPKDSWVSPRKDIAMIEKLLCSWGIGPHWLAKWATASFVAAAFTVERKGSHSARWSGRLVAVITPKAPTPATTTRR
jgi:hypothetical protein